MTPNTPSLFTGYAAAWIIVFVWAFWLIVSRVAESSGLTIYDLAALRYGLAAFVGLPLCLYYRDWQKLRLTQIAVLSFILGPLYILCVFAGFLFAPAAHGGIFMNGLLPLASIVIGITLFRIRPTARQTGGSLLIFVSALALGADSNGSGADQVWIGDLLFVIGAVFFASFVILSERWQINAIQIIFCGTVVNAALYLPVWALFLPSGIADAPTGPLLLQAIYQGFVPNLIGLLFIAHASRRIGTVSTSSILAAVPGMGGLLGMLILGEVLSPLSMAALGLLTLGLLITVRSRKQKPVL
ncbi:MAG: DMT family transporter [Sulfitobacter sp.]|nr:DMT family transporter [Sulfitobacter sp.]